MCLHKLFVATDGISDCSCTWWATAKSRSKFKDKMGSKKVSPNWISIRPANRWPSPSSRKNSELLHKQGALYSARKILQPCLLSWTLVVYDFHHRLWISFKGVLKQYSCRWVGEPAFKPAPQWLISYRGLSGVRWHRMSAVPGCQLSQDMSALNVRDVWVGVIKSYNVQSWKWHW
jgi:hypothetical protein